MKKIVKVLAVTIVSFLVSLSVSSNLQAESTDELLELFSSEVEGIHQDIEDIAEVISEALEENEFQEFALTNAINKIEERANTLIELGKKYNQEWQSEALNIAGHCRDIKVELEEQEFDEMVTAFFRIPVVLNTLEMMFPQYLQARLDRLTQELKSTIAEDNPDWDDLEPTVETLIIHSRQLNFAADAFGKKIWKKFTTQVWDICLELDEAVEEENDAEIKALLEEMEKPLKMLSKLVK